MFVRIVSVCVVIALSLSPAFATGQTNTQRGAVTGGAAGAVIGGIIGHQNDETPEGALIGGAIGAIAGGLLGNQQDQLNYQHYQQQQQYQQRRAIAFQRGVSSADVVNMSHSGVGSSVMINQIQINGVQKHLSVNEIIALSQQGVDSTVIDAMQRGRIAGSTSPVQISPAYVPRTPQVYRPRVVVEPVLLPTYRPPYSHRPTHRHHHRGSRPSFHIQIGR